MRRNVILFILFIGLLNLVFTIGWFLIPGWRTRTDGVWELIGISILLATTAEGLIIGRFKDFRDWLFPRVDPALITAPIQPITPDNILTNATLGGWIKYVHRDGAKLSDFSASPRVVIIAPRKMGKSREAAELISRVAGNFVLPDRIFTPRAAPVKLLSKNAIQRELRLQPQLASSHAPILLYIDDLPNDFKDKDLVHLKNLLDVLEILVTNLYVVATAREKHLSPSDLAWLRQNNFEIIHLPPLEGEKVGLLVDYYSAAKKIDVDDDARQYLIEHSDGTPELTLRSLRRMEDAGFSRFTRFEAQKLALTTMEETIIADLQEFTGSHPAAPALLDTLTEFHSAGLDPQLNLVTQYTIARIHGSPSLRTSSQRLRALRMLFDTLSGKYLTLDRDRILIKDTLVEQIIDQNHARRELSDFFLGYRRRYQNRYLRRFYPMAGQQAMALFSLALNAQQFDSYEQAINLYSAAIILMPHSGFYNKRGITYTDLEDYPAALVDYTRAIEMDPQDAEAYYHRAVIYTKQQDHPAALADFTAAINLDPQSGAAYNHRGVAYADQGDTSAALDDFNRAIDLDPQNSEAWYNRGLVLATLSQTRQASDAFDKALAINPDKVDAWYNRGLAMAELGETKQAVESYDQVIKIDLQNADAWYQRGMALKELGDYRQAVDSYQHALAIDGQNADIQYQLACAFALSQDDYHACKWLDRSIQGDSKYAAIARNEADFDVIRHTPLFEDILGRYLSTQ